MRDHVCLGSFGHSWRKKKLKKDESVSTRPAGYAAGKKAFHGPSDATDKRVSGSEHANVSSAAAPPALGGGLETSPPFGSAPRSLT